MMYRLFVILFVLVVPYAGGASYLSALPEVGQYKAGDKDILPQSSAVEQQLVQNRHDQRRASLNEGQSYIAPFGPLAAVKPKTTTTPAVTAPKVTTNATTPVPKTKTAVNPSALTEQQRATAISIYQATYDQTMQQLSQLQKQPIVIPSPGAVAKPPKQAISAAVQSQSSRVSLSAKHTVPSATTSVMDPGEKLLPGTVFFAALRADIDSDYPERIYARIVNGKLKGAQVSGKFERHNDSVNIHFTQMVFKGNVYTIDATALDQNNWRSALADDVNHHTFIRWGSFILASAASGLKEGLMGSTVISSPFGSSTATHAALSGTKLLGYVAGNVGSKAIPLVQRNFNIPPTVKVFAKNGIGIRFNRTVILKHAVQPKPQPTWLTTMRGTS